jgi:hypothetical protein
MKNQLSDDYQTWLNDRQIRQERQDFVDACTLAAVGMVLLVFFGWVICLEYSL